MENVGEGCKAEFAREEGPKYALRMGGEHQLRSEGFLSIGLP